MSASDVKMQKIIGKFGTWLLIGLVIYYIVRRFFNKYRDRFFAKFESAFAELYNGPSRITKQKLFAPLSEIRSSDWHLKNQGVIRILEIGAGNGANLKYYPKGSHLVFVDKNVAFEPFLHDNLKKYPSLSMERLVHCTAEDMQGVDDNSVDVVVATLVLCSVTDPQLVLQEVIRVLAPGGKFFFLEHVLAQSGTKLNKTQRILSRLRIWPTLFGGCCLDRETGKAVKQAGFSSLDIKEVDVYSDEVPAFKFIRTHVVGVATK